MAPKNIFNKPHKSTYLIGYKNSLTKDQHWHLISQIHLKNGTQKSKHLLPTFLSPSFSFWGLLRSPLKEKWEKKVHEACLVTRRDRSGERRLQVSAFHIRFFHLRNQIITDQFMISYDQFTIFFSLLLNGLQGIVLHLAPYQSQVEGQ